MDELLIFFIILFIVTIHGLLVILAALHIVKTLREIHNEIKYGHDNRPCTTVTLPQPQSSTTKKEGSE